MGNIIQKNKQEIKANNKCDKVFKNGPSKICGRQPLPKLKGYDLLKADHTL